MRDNPYYFEIDDLLIQFISAFDSIIINRYNKDRTVGQQTPVRYAYGPKQRVLHNLSNKAEHITLPAIGIYIKQIARDNDRVFSKNTGQYYNQSQFSEKIRQPVPVDITIGMIIGARYQSDMNQILSNFIPYNDPYIVISWKIPEQFTSVDQEIRTHVIWDNTISLDYPVKQGADDKMRIEAETSFVIKGWLFKKHNDSTVENIYEIKTNFYPVSSITNLNNLDVVESFTFSAYPATTNINTDEVYVNNSPTLKLEGYNYDFTKSVYLSTNNISSFSLSTTYNALFDLVELQSSDPFLLLDLSAFQLLASERWNPFLGIKLSTYSIKDDNFIYVDLPEIKEAGQMSVIVVNDAGYDKSKTIELKNK